MLIITITISRTLTGRLLIQHVVVQSQAEQWQETIVPTYVWPVNHPSLHHVQTFLHFILYTRWPKTLACLAISSFMDECSRTARVSACEFVCLYLLAQPSDLHRVCLSPNVFWDMLEPPVTMNIISRLANWWMVECLWHEHVPVRTKCKIN